MTLLLMAVPILIGMRLREFGSAAIFNFSLYPLVFSYFYLLIPSFLPSESLVASMLTLSDMSEMAVNKFSAWTVFVFAAFYFFSKDYRLSLNQDIRFSSITVKMAVLIRVVVFVVFGIIAIRHGSVLYSLAGDRSAAYEYYSLEILNAYRLPILFSFTVVSSLVLFLARRKFSELIPLSFFIVLDGLQGGRGVSLAAFMICYMCWIMVNPNAFRKANIASMLVLVLLFLSAFVRRYVGTEDTTNIWHALFGEFYYTRLTAQFTYDYFLGAGDAVSYILYAISKLIPQFLVAPFFNELGLMPYHVLLNEQSGIGFGLAGSLISESLYYGGEWGGYFSPIVIAGVYLLLQRRQVIYGLPGFVFFLLLTSMTYVILRTGFYTNLFSLVYMFVVYLGVIIIPSFKVRVLIRG